MQLETIEKCSGIKSDKFLAKYFNNRLPVIVDNFIESHSKALTEWDYSLLKQRAGEVKVNLYGREDEFDDFVTSPPVKKNVPFKEYLNIIEQGPTDLRLFLFNLLKNVPALKEDLVVNDLTGGRVLKWLPYLFFGGAGSTVRYHYDIDMSHVFLSQLQGVKEVWLFAPNQSALLYKLPFNFHGTVNLRNPDDEKYPGLHYLKGFKCTLQKGDTLYIPSGYWHYIQYTTGGWSVSYRALSESVAERLAGFRNIFITRKIDNIMRRLFKQRWFNYKVAQACKTAAKQIALLAANH